jgi:outer membrane immunogenic protein
MTGQITAARCAGRVAALAAALAVLSAGGALAADLARMPVKAAPPPVAAPSWGGFYIGGHAGYAWGSSDGDYRGEVVPPPPPPAPPIVSYLFGLRPDGASLGTQLGFNFQSGFWVLSVEGDWSWLFDAIDRVNDPAGSNRYDDIQVFWTSHARGRIGYLIGNNTLVFFAGGAAFASTRNIHYGPTGAGGASWFDTRLRTGYSLGGGFEHMLNPNWLIRLEYLFDHFAKEDFTWAAGRYSTSDLTLNTLRLGITYRPAP